MAEEASSETVPVSSRDIEQFYYESLGDRDWEEYKINELIFLKRNIGFAIYGAPAEEQALQTGNVSVSVTGYNEKQDKVINELLDIIFKNNFLENNSILIRLIFICCELNDKKKSISVEPVFILKKCIHKEIKGAVHENCIVVIDIHGRVYKSWQLYLKNNKLPKCTMVYPKDGKYTAEIINEEMQQLQVILEWRESPACKIGNLILNGTDTAGTVASVGVTATFLAAAIPGIVVAPAILTATAIGGVAVGAYSVGRSIQTLVNRRNHKQSIALDNSESRWCWLNTTVGVLGASTSAAAGLLTRAVSKGVEISQAARIAFNTINAVNIIGSGINIGYTGYSIVDKLINKESVSPLEVFQFASSILFFHQSVAGFKTASKIISETQSTTLQNYEHTLRSNRHRKLFKKAQLEARRVKGESAGNAEIISGIQHINDPDNFFAGLARINKDLNRNEARYTITADGRVEINSNYIVDPMEFASLSRNDRTKVLRNLPLRQLTSVAAVRTATSPIHINKILTIVSECCQKVLLNSQVLGKITKDIINNKFDLETISALLSDFTIEIIKSLINILLDFVNEINDGLEKEFKQLYPLVHIGVAALQFLTSYIKNKAGSLKIDFKTFLVTLFNRNGRVNIRFIQELIQQFTDWLAFKLQALRNSLTVENKYSNAIKLRIQCNICNGYYFTIVN